MTKYIKPPKQSKALAFTFGFLVGFVSFILVVVILGYFAYFGLTVKDVENFTNSQIIEEDSEFAFLKKVTLSELVSSVKIAVEDEEGFSIQNLEKALGDDVNVDIGSFLPKEIDFNKIESYVKNYTQYSSIKEIPIKELGSVLSDIGTSLTVEDILDIVTMVGFDASKYYDDFKLSNFDELISYVYADVEGITQIKDLKIVELPNAVQDIIEVIRLKDLLGITDKYLGEDVLYQKIADILLNYGLNYSSEKIEDIVNAINSSLGEDKVILEAVKNLDVLLDKDLKEILAIDNSENDIIQLLPLTNDLKLSDLNSFLNTYFKQIPLNDLILADNSISFCYTLEDKLDSLNNDTSLLDLSLTDFQDREIGEIIESEKGIFTIPTIKSSYVYNYDENCHIFDLITLQDLVDAKLITIEEYSEVYPYLNYTLKELESLEKAKNTLLTDLLNYEITLEYNPYFYNSSIKELLENDYKYLRLSDIYNLGITFNTEEGGFLNELPKNVNVKDVLNLHLDKILGSATIGDLLESGDNNYQGVITLLYDIKVSDLLNKSLLECIEGKEITIGKLLEIDENETNTILLALKDIRLDYLSEDLESIEIGELLGLTKDTNINTYTKELNSGVSSIILKMASSTIKTIQTDIDTLMDTIKIGEILDLKTDNGIFVGDESTSKIILAISDYTITGLQSALDNEIKIGDLLGLEKINGEFVKDENVSNVLLAISNYTIKGLQENIDNIKIGTLLGVETDENGVFVGNSETSSIILAISDFTFSNIATKQGIESVEIGKLLGLTKDSNEEYTKELNSGINAVILKIANLNLNNLESNINSVINDLTIGEVLGISYDEEKAKYVFENDSDKEVSNIMICLVDTKVMDLDSKINSISIGDMLGLKKDENNNFTEELNPTASTIILKIASSNLSNIEQNIDEIIASLKLSDVVDFDEETSSKLLLNLKDTEIKNIQTTINNMALSDAFDLTGENSVLSLLKIYDEDGNETNQTVTIGNVDKARVDITKLTIKDLRNYGFIKESDLSNINENTTLQTILDKVNEYGYLFE